MPANSRLVGWGDGWRDMVKGWDGWRKDESDGNVWTYKIPADHYSNTVALATDSSAVWVVCC